MVTLHDLRSERIGSTKPIARVIEKGDDFKILGLAIAKDIALNEHKTNQISKLIVLEGSVEYVEENRSFTLKHYDEFDIPVGIMHALIAKEDSLCLLIQKSNG